MEQSIFNWKRLALAALVIAVLAAIFIGPKALRVYRVIHLFDEDIIVENFLGMEDIFPVKTLTAAPNPFIFDKGEPMPLLKTFPYEGKDINVEDWFEATQTTGLLIIHKGNIRLEQYYRGHSEDGHHISWSVAKSFISALVGIALEEGAFASIEDPVTRYVPELKNTGYDGVRIKDILQMSSGVKFNEDYGDYNSDINIFGRTLAGGGSLDDFSASLEREIDPGIRHHYVSIDTQVLGMLLVRVTGKSLTEYMQEKIWTPLGMEYPGYFIADDSGMELALGGLNVSLRDYGKLGYLYLNQGSRAGVQIVPKQWIRDSTTPDAPHLLPGENPLSSSIWGYGYQWWIPTNPDGEYLAAGIYNQYIYVYPKHDLVIVKNTANHNYTRERAESKAMHVEFFREIARELGE